MGYTLIYWKGLNKDDVKVRQYETEEEANTFLENNPGKYKEFLLCKEVTGKHEQGVTHYQVLNRGAYILYKIVAYAISITVMVAIIAGFLYLRYRCIH